MKRINKTSKYLIVAFISLLVLQSDVQAKNTSCKNKFKDEDWIYCTKFGAHTTAQLDTKMRAKFLATYKKLDEKISIELAMYKDQDFDELVNDKSLVCSQKREKAQSIIKIEVPVDGTWSEYYSSSLFNYNIPRIYYYVVMDCEHETHTKNQQMPKIELELDIVNNYNGQLDHFSYETRGFLNLHIVMLVIYILVFGATICSYMKYQQMFERYDSPHFAITIAVFFQMSSIFMGLLHYWVYSLNGRGVPIFDIFSLISGMMSEITFSCLFMMFAYGWTLSFQEINWDNNLEIFLPVGSIVVAIHLVLAAMTYIDVDASHKYHDFAGIQGFVLVLFKMCLFAYYIYCYYSNKDLIPKRSLGFYKVFIIMGSCYFMTVPGTIYTSYLFQPYNRQFIYTMVTNLVQLGAACLLLLQLSSTKSKYFKASMGSQGILPMDKMN